jgi:tRNA threonylcarbamoyladenosine modification (KEOPS) complex  Pcc1 subunit
LIQIELLISTASPRQAEILVQSLSLEVEEAGWDRLETNAKKSGNECVIDIRATDLAALRAALNSYLRWTTLVLGLLQVVEKGAAKSNHR